MEKLSSTEAIVAALAVLAAGSADNVRGALATLSPANRAKIADAVQHAGESTEARIASLSRKTKETAISVSVRLDGSGKSDIKTGLGFYDHMLTALSKHSLIDIALECKGDLEVDDHHTVEDCALALGAAVDKALGDKVGLVRYGSAHAPLDEALARCVVDLSGRPGSEVDLQLKREKVGEVSTEMLTHSLQSFATSARLTLHVDVLKGVNDHHKAEAAFKALALALRQAISVDSRRPSEVASTKGSL